MDTFVDMVDWGKGVIFVNGKNLGRYWKICGKIYGTDEEAESWKKTGPQETLYLPGKFG